MKIINIAKDFSVFPGGRFKKDSEYSAEEFRDTILIPSIKKHNNITIELDGTRGYSSCFLEEVFGGLIRIGYNKEYINSHINFISTRKSLITEIQTYIQDNKGK